MPQKVVLEDGTEQEVFTQEELQAQREAAIEEYKSQNPDRTEELSSLQAELAKANKDLEGFKNKDLNFSNLRKEKDGLEKKIDDLTKTIDEKVITVKKEVLEGVVQDFYNEELTSRAGGDDELKKKIEYHYKRLTDPAGTKADVSKKLNDAYLLATRQEGESMSAFSSGRVSAPRVKESALTEDDKDLLRKMGKGHLTK